MPKFYGDSDPVTAVLSYCSMLENRADTQARYSQHDDDEKLWRLEPYTLEEVESQGKSRRDWPSATLNGPRTLWNVCRHALTTERPKFRIELPSLSVNEPAFGVDAEEQSVKQALEETDRHERFAVGLFQMVDERRVLRSMRPLQSDLAFHACVRGGMVARMWYDPTGTEPFDLALWDPRAVIYDIGAEGLSFVAHHYWTSIYDVLDRYAQEKDLRAELSPDGHGNVEVYDCWWLEDDKVYNVVCSGRCQLLPAQEMPKLDHLPVYIVRSFGPDIEANYQTQGNTARILDAWESIYTANRETYRWLNRIASLYGLYLARNAIGPYQGEVEMDATQLQAAMKPFGFFKLEQGSGGVRPVPTAQMASEAKEFFSTLQGAEQRGGVPYSVYGQLPFELSGFAINQLRGGVGIIVDEVARAMGWMYRMLTDEAIQQFRARGRKLVVHGMDQRRRQFIEDIKRSSLRDKYYLEVEIEPSLPVDRLQEAQIAQAWAALGVDPITIADEVLKLRDPRQVLERMVAWRQLQQEIELRVQGNTPIEKQPEFMAPEMLPPQFNGMQARSPAASTGVTNTGPPAGY